MKTIEAFSEMINKRGVHTTLKMNAVTVRSLRLRLKNNEFISYDKMMELLIRAGYQIETEMSWTDPAKSPSKK